jgi:hypothetical protein
MVEMLERYSISILRMHLILQHIKKPWKVHHQMLNRQLFKPILEQGIPLSAVLQQNQVSLGQLLYLLVCHLDISM